MSNKKKSVDERNREVLVNDLLRILYNSEFNAPKDETEDEAWHRRAEAIVDANYRHRSPIMNPRQVAVYLNKTESAIRNWRFTDRGPAWTQLGNNEIGRKTILYHADDVDAWVDEMKHDPAWRFPAAS